MWGNNMHNELGDGTDEHRYSPIDITDGFSLDESEIITDISLGHYHSGAITSLGRILCGAIMLMDKLVTKLL